MGIRFLKSSGLSENSEIREHFGEWIATPACALARNDISMPERYRYRARPKDVGQLPSFVTRWLAALRPALAGGTAARIGWLLS